ncbi:MAG: valine--tRNA ligase [Actinobacteria bacterium]|nr:valine--tRNA ligase [Actinomycetota bacterium]
MSADGPTPARYDPSEQEPRWAAAWLASGEFVGDPNRGGEAFSIAVPPPNVTGSLHMGHALNGTIQDILIRSHRMAGRPTMWICGTDHAGIATQAVVEKQLAVEGTRRQDLGREAFERRVWEWKAESGSQIIHQFQRLGCTLDYSRERFTMDDAYARAVGEVFVRLYEKGLIYRDRYLVNWDPGLGSAISDLELEDREVTDTLVRIAYPLADGSGEVVVATVRPETMLGDTAVAVHPDDDRYRHLVGRSVTLPLSGREVPIIADAHVDPAFGTGCLKVTPAHDPNDFEIARRHGLPEIGVIGEDGRMTAAAGDRYAGLIAADAARRVLDDLRSGGSIRGEEPYTHTVPFSERSGRRVEPLISLQWFCDMSTLAPPAIEVVRSGRVRFHPENWARVYLRWMDEIRPWCVSRQLWWGHQLPVWYRGDDVYVGLDAPAGDGWERDPDVLDTWFSSALWPFATLGWPDETDLLDRFYPTSVLSTARDIIFLWVARMIMMGLEYLDEVPFSDVVIHATVQAPDGRRMSKSLGTGVDPLELIDEHGADAVRFGLVLMSSTQDVRFNVEKIRQGRQLVTKIWNATSLIAARGGALTAAPAALGLADRWMTSRVRDAIAEADGLLARFEFSAFADLVYHVIFDDFCDWYLEFLKRDQATPTVAARLLESLLALAHPIVPFVTEACWERIPGASGLMLTHESPGVPWPTDANAAAVIERVKEAVRAIRAFRAETRIPPRAGLVAALADGKLGGHEAGALVAGLASVEWRHRAPEDGAQLAVSFGTLVVDRPAGNVDVTAERSRIAQAIANAERERARAHTMLANPRFGERAPAELVAAERAKLERFTSEIAALRAEHDAIDGR